MIQAVGTRLVLRTDKTIIFSCYSAQVLAMQNMKLFFLTYSLLSSIGCILLTVGQNKFNAEAIETLNFVANQSDFTVQILRNVTDFLSFARTINVGPVYLPSDVQQQIDKVKGDLTDASGTISQKTQENYRRIRLVIGDVYDSLIL